MFTTDMELIKPILVLEDDPTVQDRIYNILEKFGYEKMDVTFVQTIKGAIEQYNHSEVNLILVDLGLPDGNGVDFITHVRVDKNDCEIPIMVISAWNSAEVILKALTAGATGYVLKERDDFELIYAIRSLLRGGVIIDPFIANQILKNVHIEDKIKKEKSHIGQLEYELSVRELEILNLVAEGNSSKEMSELLNISKFTVDCHIKNIYHKLSVNSRTKAINMAKTIGLIS